MTELQREFGEYSLDGISRLLNNPVSRAWIEEHAVIGARKVASKVDRLLFWTAIMDDKDQPGAVRLRASELLGKAAGDFDAEAIRKRAALATNEQLRKFVQERIGQDKANKLIGQGDEDIREIKRKIRAEALAKNMAAYRARGVPPSAIEGAGSVSLGPSTNLPTEQNGIDVSVSPNNADYPKEDNGLSSDSQIVTDGVPILEAVVTPIDIPEGEPETKTAQAFLKQNKELIKEEMAAVRELGHLGEAEVIRADTKYRLERAMEQAMLNDRDADDGF
jgi:hypothetical protein